MKTGLDDYLESGKTRDDFLALLKSAERIYPQPQVSINNGSVIEPSQKLAKALACRGEFYWFTGGDSGSMGGSVVYLGSDNSLTQVTPEQMVSEFERAAKLGKEVERDGEKFFVKTKISKQLVSEIEACRDFKAALPPITAVSKCPMLVRGSDGLKAVSGYDPETRILASGGPVLEIPFQEAVERLLPFFDDTKFFSPGDKSRFYANLISPALTLSEVLPCRAPIAYNEADDSQTGKGYLHKCLAAVYNSQVYTCNTVDSGVGGIEEKFGTQLIAGRTFISWDNLTSPRNGAPYDSEFLCSFMTEERCAVRAPYKESVSIDPKRHVVMLTTNGCNLSRDLTNRCCPIRLCKREAGFQYRRYKEGYLLDHIRAWQSYYLGCVFAIVKEYYRLGMPRLEDISHDTSFTPWFQHMGYIVEKMLGLAPILEGLEKVRERASSPVLNRLRDIAIAVRREGLLGHALTASKLVEIGINIMDKTNINALEEQEKAKLAMGRWLAPIFRDTDQVKLDSFTVTKGKMLKEYEDLGKEKEIKTYTFEETPDDKEKGENNRGEDVLEPMEGSLEPIAEPIENPSEPIEPISSENFSNEESVCSLCVKKDQRSIGSMGSIGSIGSKVNLQPPLSSRQHCLALNLYFIHGDQPSPNNLALSLSIRHPNGRFEERKDIAPAIKELKAFYGQDLEQVAVAVYDASMQLAALQKHGAFPKCVLDIKMLACLFQHKDEPVSLGALAQCYGLQPHLNAAELIQNLAIKMLEAGVPQQELDLVDHSARMPHQQYVRIDKSLAKASLERLEQHISQHLEEADCQEADIVGNKSFNGLVNKAFTDEGLEPPVKKLSNAPGKALLAELEASTVPRAKKLAELRRLLDSARSIRSQLKQIVDSASAIGGYMPVSLEYHNTITGRFTGGAGFNFHGIPSPSRYEGVLKESVESIGGSLTAQDGYKFVSADASQIEARLLAYAAGEKDLSQAFAEGRDIYSEFASSLFGEPAGKAEGDSPEATRMRMFRKIGKTAILGLGYQMGGDLFYKKLQESKELALLLEDGTITIEKCRNIVNAYRNMFPGIVEFWNKAKIAFIEAVNQQSLEPVSLGALMFRRTGNSLHIELPSGRRIIYPDVKVCNGEICSGKDNNLYGGKLVENIIQAIARDLLANAILELEKQGWPVVCHIHDEIICLAPEQRAEECLEAMINAWRSIPEWMAGLALDAEGRIGNNFNEI